MFICCEKRPQLGEGSNKEISTDIEESEMDDEVRSHHHHHKEWLLKLDEKEKCKYYHDRHR